MRRAVGIKLLIFMSLLIVGIGLVIKLPISCNLLIDQRLVDAPFDSDDATDMRYWVEDKYSIDRWWLSQKVEGDVTILHWRSWMKEFDAFHRGNYQSIHQKWIFSNVTIRDVQSCLGRPDAYTWSSRFIADAFNAQFAIWYQQQGYIFSTGRFYTLEQPVIDLDTPLWTMIVVEPTAVAEMAQAAYPQGLFDERVYSDTLTTMKAWPPLFESVALTRTDLE